MTATFEAFQTRAAAVSAEVHRFATRHEGLAFIECFLREVGVSEAPGSGALWVDGSFLEGIGSAHVT